MAYEEDEQFRQLFRAATGFDPYAWQTKAAVERLPQILPIPTGLGKTEGSALAWAWRRFTHQSDEPLHLVYCLPMRSLVRRTVERLREGWDALPDRPWVLVGTQDMLLSRSLNRGYGMSRFDWPVHFGLLNQRDPEEMRQIVRRCQNAVSGEVARFDGYVAKFMGDGALAYFGWPKAHEDEAGRAVRAAVAAVLAEPVPTARPRRTLEEVPLAGRMLESIRERN